MGISKTKVQCEKCKKKFRKVKVKKSKHSGKMLCTFCRKNEVTNPFYIPKNKNESIGKYNMTDTEKRLLRTNLMSRGMSFNQANYEIAKKCGILNYMKRVNQAKAIQNSYQRTEDKKRQESFVGGLGQ